MLLGGLIGTATGNKSGLMSVEDKKRLGRRFFKGYTKLVESKYWYNHYVALIFGASPASNLGSLIAIDWKGDEPISVTRFLGNNDNVKLYLGRNPETNMHELWLGLIGLDGDGSEFIIQSRESIDLDSKTVETLPSYLKVIPISWQKNNDFSELGGLIGVDNTIIKNKNSRVTDFNKAVEAGVYQVNLTNNIPPEANGPTSVYGNGILIVFTSIEFIGQIYIPLMYLNIDNIYIRERNSSDWFKWRKFNGTEL